MNKKVKTLKEQNSIEEEKIKDENQEIYTDIIVYLRGSRITEYNQELVRRDIIQMMLDGEARGQRIEEIIGGNYREFCDEIIGNFPLKTVKQKIVEGLDTGLICFCILGTINIVTSVAENILQKNSLTAYSLSLADVINYLLFVGIAVTVVNRICRNAFEKTTGQRKKEALILFFLVTACLGTFIGIQHFLNGFAVSFHIGIAVGFVLAAYIIHRITTWIIEEDIFEKR